MRKFLVFITAIFISGSLIAGGLVTNTNQSAMFTRLQNRNASTGIDAVYYNPAGLTKLGNGFFASINNQVIGQKKTVISNYQFLAGTPKEYVGNVSAPLFPGVYVAYNTGNFGFSAGFNPIGGGGGAEYKTGLPSFETSVANLVPLLNSEGFGVTKYDANIYFKGTSVYFGYQANVSYKINDMFSVAAGFRYVTAKNTYSGYLKNIQINPTYAPFGGTGSMMPATDFFNNGAAVLTALSVGASQYVTGLQPIVTGGGGGVLLSNGTIVGLTSAQIGQIQQILGAAGLTPAQIGAQTIASAQGVLSGAAPVFADNATILSENAVATQDVTVDASESGSGYTPILSVNFSPTDKLNIALKYEFKTKLTLTQKVVNNQGAGIFVDGTKVIADMPALFTAGVDYKIMDNLSLSGSFNYYWDKNVDYDGSASLNINMIDHNFMEYGLGAEYGVSEKLRVSGGWVHTTTGVNLNYQNEQTYSTNTNSFGAGFGYRIAPKIDLNIGGQYTVYKDGSKSFTDIVASPYTETYKKNTWIVAAGLDFYFGK